MGLKILATAPGFEKAAAVLSEVGEVDVIWDDSGSILSEDELSTIITKYDAAVVWIDPLRGKAMNAAKNKLKVIGVPRAGFDNVDVEAATQSSIPVIYSPGMNSAAVSDFTFGLILGLCRGIVSSNMLLKTDNWKGRWAMFPGSNLEGKILGIIGLGNIGSRVAMKARAFGMKVIACDPYVTDDSPTLMGMFPKELGVDMVNLQTILKLSDFVVIHAPISTETTHMISQDELKIMKKESYLLNVSRGGVVDENALYVALKDGVIAGAALDVFEKEPFDPSNPLISLDNVIVTPHIAWCTKESMERSNMAVAIQVLNILKGKKPSYRYLANPNVF